MNRLLAVLVAACILAAGARPAHATLPMQKQAKEAGLPSNNCLYCHNEKLPIKGKVVSHNARGTFLVKQKEARKAKEVDGAWLKDYVEPRK